MPKCKECKEEQPDENFYVQDGFRLFKTCKECIKEKKKVAKRPKGFACLPPAVQEGIREDLQNRKLKMVAIADKYNINYATLTYWVRKGSYL